MSWPSIAVRAFVIESFDTHKCPFTAARFCPLVNEVLGRQLVEYALGMQTVVIHECQKPSCPIASRHRESQPMQESNARALHAARPKHAEGGSEAKAKATPPWGLGVSRGGEVLVRGVAQESLRKLAKPDLTGLSTRLGGEIGVESIS